MVDLEGVVGYDRMYRSAAGCARVCVAGSGTYFSLSVLTSTSRISVHCLW